MSQPLWLLLPWTVFALAVALKAWRLGSLVHRQLLARPSSTERARQALERIWAQN